MISTNGGKDAGRQTLAILVQAACRTVGDKQTIALSALDLIAQSLHPLAILGAEIERIATNADTAQSIKYPGDHGGNQQATEPERLAVQVLTPKTPAAERRERYIG